MLICSHSLSVLFFFCQCVEEVGTIVKIVDPDLARVQYEDAYSWTVIRHLLTRVKKNNVKEIEIRFPANSGRNQYVIVS